MQPEELRQLSRQLVRQLGLLDNHCGLLKLTPVQAHTLIELEYMSCTVSQMADKLKVDKSNASRTLAVLLNLGLVESTPNPDDKRSQLSQLTLLGQQTLTSLHTQLNLHVQTVLDQMDSDEITKLKNSLTRYNKAINTASKQHEYTLRPLTPLDNASVAAIIRKVSAGYGLTADKGYGVADPTLDSMSEVYQPDGCQYWVVEKDHRILGGGGVAALSKTEGVCELQKMYFLNELRGKGLDRSLAGKALKITSEWDGRAWGVGT